jgi:exopolyphosphatase/guanosine-5'-triphosphate,3'-diphosphate pyrophosphatase
MPKGWRKRAANLALLLRLAVLFNRSRTSEFPDLLGLSVDDRIVKLRLSRSWLDVNPLTLADLEQEQAYLQDVGYDLQLATA